MIVLDSFRASGKVVICLEEGKSPDSKELIIRENGRDIFTYRVVASTNQTNPTEPRVQVVRIGSG